jgi:hypothetical protein
VLICWFRFHLETETLCKEESWKNFEGNDSRWYGRDTNRTLPK